MNKIYILLFLAVLMLFKTVTGQVINDAIYSQALGQSKYVDVYLPPGYNSNPAQSYPVIYFLHGWAGSQNSAETIMDELESLINSGQVDPMIMVCADNGATPYSGSFFVNSTLNGDYEDFNVIDLVGWVESNYRAIPDRNHRALMGQSMGGYGSFRYGIMHKDKFSVIAAHGSAINFDLALNDISLEIFAENQPGPPYFYDFNNTGLYTQMIYAMSGAFSPNLNTPQDYIDPKNVEFPLDDQGVLIDTVYAKWNLNDPAYFIQSLLPQDSVAILFGAGSNDNLYLYPPNIALKDSLDKYGLSYEFYDHAGSHGMPVGFKVRALEFIDSVLSAVPVIPPCNLPSTQFENSLTSTSVQLNWTENGTATNWEIRLGLSGFDTTAVTPTAIATNPYVWNNLNPSTSYDWYVRSGCDNGNTSEWTGPSGFTTLSGGTLLPASLPFTEGWENSSGIIQTDGDFVVSPSHSWAFETDRQNEGRLRWGNNAYVTQSGAGALTLDKHPNNGTYAINGAILTINLSNYASSADLELSFWWTDHADEDQTDDKVWIRGRASDEWLEIYDINPVSNPDNVFQYVGGLNINQILSSATPQQNITESFQLRFGQKDNSFAPGDGLSFDEISISTSLVANCIEPSGLATSNITQTTADFSWIENGSATDWDILVGLADFDTTGQSSISVSTNPYTLSGLTAGTGYDVYVRSNCGADLYSSFIGPLNFTTQTSGSGVLNPVVLPFIEGWETENGTIQTNDVIYTASAYEWTFETDKPNEGRGRYGSNANLTQNGSGALTLDKYPNNGTYAVNGAILTINMINYASSSDIELSFWWTDHKDEDQAEDKVWVRGSSNETWIQLFDLNPATSDDNVYQFVGGLDIDQVLSAASPPQSISESFQIRFGQKDNSFTPGDGLSFDEISLTSSGVASCTEPSLLTVSSVTQESAIVSWIENGNASSWEMLYGISGFDTTGQSPIPVSTNPYSLTGLAEGLLYDVYLRSNCGSGLYSDFIGPATFLTLSTNTEDLDPATLPFTEDWESSNGVIQTNGLMFAASSHEWTFETDKPNEGRGRWGTNAYLVQSGSGALTMDKHPNNGTYAVNGAILTVNLENYSNSIDLELSFWWADHNDEDQTEDKVWIRGSPDDEWAQIFDLNPALQDNNIYFLVSGLDIDQTLSAASPQQTVGSSFQIKFGQKDNSFTAGDGLSFDNITIEETQQQANCSDPSGQMEGSITETSAELSWTENGDASNWEILFGLSGFDTTGLTPAAVQANPFNWSGLTATTTYDWYVRASCDNGVESNFVGPATFTTSSPPPPPSGILPFTEDWESQSGTRQTDGNMYSETDYSWSFTTDYQNGGRARWGTNAYSEHSGVGALTLDRSPAGSSTSNRAVLTIDLSPYVNSADLLLSFWWTDHKDEEHAGDKIWLRGSDTDQWIEFYDLNPKQYSNNTFHLISGLDIDSTLASASQSVSATTQIAFGQQDNFPTSNDGMSFDDITIEEDAGYQPSSFSDITFSDEPDSEEAEVTVYSNRQGIFIRSRGEMAFENKEVEVYDIFGRLILRTSINASNLEKITVQDQKGYLIIKVKGKETITVSKVFIN